MTFQRYTGSVYIIFNIFSTNIAIRPDAITVLYQEYEFKLLSFNCQHMYNITLFLWQSLKGISILHHSPIYIIVKVSVLLIIVNMYLCIDVLFS